MVLTPISWANRVWALPFLTALAPSEGYYADKPRAHKPLSDWARQMLLIVKRWVGERQVIAVGDGSYAVLNLLRDLQGQVSLISRFRFDAALYGPIPVRVPGQVGRPRLKGDRLPSLATLAADPNSQWLSTVVREWYGGQSPTVEYLTGTALWYQSGKPTVEIRWVIVRFAGKLTALVSNDIALSAPVIIGYFARRWSMETSFGLVRAHLGVETQRQWSPKAIARMTPVLMGLFSIVSLLADKLQKGGLLRSQVSSWYVKADPTISDALACVRRYLWTELDFYESSQEAVMVKMSPQQYQLWQNALTWAA